MGGKEKNSNLHAAKRSKNDEFYTQRGDIENELHHYKEHFKGKTVYCNCDDPTESGFFRYFALNFEFLELKRLIATGYTEGGRGRVFVYDGDKNGNRVPDPEEIEVTLMQGDGDFRSEESIRLLMEADIVCTNPPFSLFREYVAQLVEYGKKFLVIGNVNSITYKEIFPLIKDNRLWLGYNCVRHFSQPDGSTFETARTFWYTNLDHDKRRTALRLVEAYSPDKYPTYDNYDAIEVSKVVDIPMDYYGAMGVPITFLDKYCPEQFEIVDANDYRRSASTPRKTHGLVKDKDSAIGGKPTYVRILVKRRPPF